MGAPATPLPRDRGTPPAGLGAPGWGRVHQPAWVAEAASTWVGVTGWLAMAQLGMVLGWSWFSGLWAVALWWLWQSVPRQRPAGRGTLLLAAGAALGLVLAHEAGRGPLGLIAAVVAILGWAEVARRLPGMALDRPGHSREATMARGIMRGLALAGAAWLVTADAPGGWTTWAMAVSLPTAVVLAGASGRATQAANSESPPPWGHHPTMALMMGTLLAMGQWCAAAGVPLFPALVLHGLAMTLGVAAACAMADPVSRGVSRAWAGALLLGSGILLLVSADWRLMLLAVALLTAGDTLDRMSAARNACPRCASPSSHALAGHACGAAALLGVGHALPTLGPSALVAGWWATLAAGLALTLVLQRARS